VDSFPRLWPYLKPFSRQLIVSGLLGIVIAGLWGGNMTVAFPIVKLLLEHTSLHEYVDQRIAAATENETRLIADQEVLDQRLKELEAEKTPRSNSEYLELLESSAKKQRNLAKERDDILLFGRLNHYVMPWVPQNEFHTLIWLFVFLAVATLIKGVLTYWQDVLIGGVSEQAVAGLRKDLLDRVLKLDYQTLNREGASGLMSRFTYDAEQIATGIGMLGGRMIREPLKCLACMGLAMYFNWRLTLLSLIFIPLLGLFLARVGTLLKRASRKMMESMSSIYKVLEETFDGLKVVVGFHNAEHHRKLFDQQYNLYFRKAMRVVRIDAAAKPLLEFFGMLAMFLALIPGTYLVIRGKTDLWGVQLTSHVMDGAELAMLYALLAGLLDPCRKLSSVFPRLKRSTAAIDRIFNLIDRETLIPDPKTAEPLPRHHQNIEFRDISFRYPSNDPQAQRPLALEHLNLTVRFGEVIAIVGSNGCGKSTLVNLLPRFYDPDAGQILIDGRPLREIRLEELRHQVGVVMQETILFDGTILDNIRYGSDNVTRAQITDAARRAHVMPILDKLPNGFDTMIGGKGKELSGGQRQRIALARMILRDPSILVLDEATSAADAESETLIHQALKEFVQGRTTFLISHTISQSLLDFVTRIVVMEQGQIIATGTHEQLLEVCPIYHKLYHAPSRQLGLVQKAA